MTSQEPSYPWIFHRDEIDLLEDELEDLYERFCRDTSDKNVMERAVLSEQLETEDRSDRELSARLGFDVVENRPDPQADNAPQQDATEVWQQEVRLVQQHPLYQRVKAWVALVKPFSKRAYEMGGPYAGEVFRVYANLNLIQLKVFTALSEELREDQIGVEIALEEYRLALVYLERMLESVGLVFFSVQDLDWLRESQSRAQSLRLAILEQQKMLNRRKR